MADRVTSDDLIKLVEDALLANMNMIRIWGGGYYGSDALYDLCDEKGILMSGRILCLPALCILYEKTF